jgi:hypothetical protein
MSQYKKKLEKAGRSLRDLDKPMSEAGKIALAAIKSYPPYDDGWKNGKPSFIPYRPGSKYKRKGDNKGLKSGIKGRLTKGSKIVVRYRITSGMIAYDKYVFGNEQSAIHRPWWRKVEAWEPIIRPEVTKIFQEFMKSLGK